MRCAGQQLSRVLSEMLKTSSKEKAAKFRRQAAISIYYQAHAAIGALEDNSDADVPEPWNYSSTSIH
jgi:hypothetical protein